MSETLADLVGEAVSLRPVLRDVHPLSVYRTEFIVGVVIAVLLLFMLACCAAVNGNKLNEGDECVREVVVIPSTTGRYHTAA